LLSSTMGQHKKQRMGPAARGRRQIRRKDEEP